MDTTLRENERWTILVLLCLTRHQCAFRSRVVPRHGLLFTCKLFLESVDSLNSYVKLCSLVALLLSCEVAQSQTASESESISGLRSWLQAHELNDESLDAVSAQPIATSAMSKQDAEAASQLLWSARAEFLKSDYKAEFDARELVIGELKMPFWYKTFGDAPAGGRSLFISMHGGGGTTAAVNDQQYENQKRLYQPAEGIYLVPRAPTNTWNLWHQDHIDQFFDRLITDMILFENVSPDRIYFMGYSAGGDGVYQLAPRMADRLAAAAMMAGHPNEARPEGLRNIGFTIHMGAKDAAYNRNKIAGEWSVKLANLRDADPDGYVHEVQLHEGRGHWMNLEDAVAVPWMSKFTRNGWPKKIVWVQDDVRHSRFYWLQVDAANAAAGDEVTAVAEGNTIRVEKCSPASLTFLLSDQLLDLDQPVSIIRPDGQETKQTVPRTIGNLAASLKDRSDATGLSCSRLTIELK